MDVMECIFIIYKEFKNEIANTLEKNRTFLKLLFMVENWKTAVLPKID